MAKSMQIGSVARALALLDCLAQSGGPLPLKELSSRMGMPKSTLHGLLSTMREYRVVAQDEYGRYRLGAHLLELSSAIIRQSDVVGIAKPLLQSISREVEESACVCVLDGDYVLVLDSVAAMNPMRVMTDAGMRLPLHASAPGKAILAKLPEDEALRLIRLCGLAAYTPHTITDIKAIVAERLHIQEMGYAIDNGELRVGMRAVAAAISGPDGKYSYAIAVTGMFRKITDETFQTAQALVVEAAQTISKRISGE
ncbi:MAG: IclR family transcriptional regulator [Clostridia bacterium]